MKPAGAYECQMKRLDSLGIRDGGSQAGVGAFDVKCKALKEYILMKMRATKSLEKTVVKIYGQNANEFCTEVLIKVERENVNQM